MGAGAGKRSSSGVEPEIVRAATLPDLFQKAAVVWMSEFVDLTTIHPGGLRDRIRAEAPNAEALLAAWMERIHFLFASQNEVFHRFEIRKLTETVIEAEGEGELFDPGRHRLRAAAPAPTFRIHSLEQTPEGWEAKIDFGV